LQIAPSRGIVSIMVSRFVFAAVGPVGSFLTQELRRLL